MSVTSYFPVQFIIPLNPRYYVSSERVIHMQPCVPKPTGPRNALGIMIIFKRLIQTLAQTNLCQSLPAYLFASEFCAGANVLAQGSFRGGPCGKMLGVLHAGDSQYQHSLLRTH